MLSYLNYFKYFIVKRNPAEITFFITALCNFRCQHCFNLERIRKANPKEELSIKEIEKITETIPSFMRLSLSGGEPFLRNDLVQICKSFYDNCRVKFITIPTNAYLTEKIIKDVREITKSCPKLFLHISLSLDALREDRDQIVRRKDTFDNLLKTAQELKKTSKIAS